VKRRQIARPILLLFRLGCINESFTLDAAPVPNFEQAQSDNQMLSLSPFEVQFNENRHFLQKAPSCSTRAICFASEKGRPHPLDFSA
jgi:hypothetical protein